MIVADFECPSGHVTEHLCHPKQKKAPCHCGKKAKRIISLGRVNTANECPSWLPSVLEVVDKSNKARHVQEFVKNPTRETYRAWMAGEGIRPMDHTEHGAPPVSRKAPEPDLGRMTAELAKRHRERQRIEVR